MLFLLSLFLTGANVYGQSSAGAAATGPEVILLRADSLVEAGAWEAGIHEYNRFQFYATDFKVMPGIYHRKGLLYKKNERYEEAAEEFKLGLSYQRRDSLHFQMEYELGLMCFLMGKYGEAAFHLETAWENDPLATQAGIMAILAHHQRFDWNAAEKLGREVFAEDPEWVSELSLDYEKLRKTKFKSRKTALWLSVLLPGTGQWYGGKFWRGVVSALLILGFAAFTIFAVIWGRYFLAFFTPFSLFQRFFQGGWKYADSLVRLHNQNLQIRQAKKMNEKILERAATRQ